jgi:hypothetical protein
MAMNLTSSHQLKIREILQIVEVCHIYLSNSMNLPGPKPCTVFHYEYSLPGCIYRSPDILSLNYNKTINLSITELKDSIYDAMASCALYREYMVDVEKHRSAIQVKFAPRPRLQSFHSGKWTYYRNRLAQFC